MKEFDLEEIKKSLKVGLTFIDHDKQFSEILVILDKETEQQIVYKYLSKFNPLNLQYRIMSVYSACQNIYCGNWKL